MNSRRPKAKPTKGTGQRRLSRFMLLGAGVLIGVILAVLYAPNLWNKGEPDKPVGPEEKQGETKTTAANQPAKSPYKNTLPEVHYVGSQACIACHEDEHKTYQHTGMAQSMAPVDLSREPPDGAFDHPASRSRYEVVRREGKMWHRELLLRSSGEPLLLQEYPVTYVTGSGRHSLTYVALDDGFMMESPITWYTSRKAWGMSPGYDREGHSGFEREIGETCLVCHAGQAKAEGKSLHRMKVTEAAIGCEQCHGPGELHVQRQKGSTKSSEISASAFDDTIVNPAHLSRELSEAVCQQCHLRGSAAVFRKGKQPSDFRPGLPLGEFVEHYELETPNQQMSVVGHVEQMHQSKCFQKTETFSCLTCHGPHGDPQGEKLTARYIQVCNSCHQPNTCKVSPEQRKTESPENNCLICHMPQTETDIPHLAFTHHRVGIHQLPLEAKHATATNAVSLRPALEVSHVPEAEQKRSLGLGYLEVANKEESPPLRRNYQRQAHSLLSEARAEAGPDGTVDAWLARLRFELGMPDVQRYAQSALTDESLTGQDLCNALFFLADSQYQQRRYQEAIETLKKLGQLRRHSVQWLLMAQCQKAVGNEQEMEAALLTAVHINPRLTKIHQDLAEIYRKRGNEARAKYHEERAVP